MLTGRESLIRLVGKRRRFLPNRDSLLSTPIQGSLNLSPDTDDVSFLGKAVEEHQEAKSNQLKDSRDKHENGTSLSNDVACPVCGSKIPGEDYEINDHLDVCLFRGTKRKLTQRTLLQLNFSPIPKVQSFYESKKSDKAVVLSDPDDSIIQNLSNGLPEFAAEEESENNKCELTEDLESNHRIGCTINSLSLSLKNEMPDCEVTDSGASISGVALETFIVGRRYTDQKEISSGVSISLLRDPDNVKDPNAIKVVSADSGCCKLFGFLSRELAQYLSPLIDKYGLRFERKESTAENSKRNL